MRRWRWRRGSCKVSGALFEQKKQQEHALAIVAKEAKQAKRWQLTATIKRERAREGERERGRGVKREGAWKDRYGRWCTLKPRIFVLVGPPPQSRARATRGSGFYSAAGGPPPLSRAGATRGSSRPEFQPDSLQQDEQPDDRGNDWDRAQEAQNRFFLAKADGLLTGTFVAERRWREERESERGEMEDSGGERQREVERGTEGQRGGERGREGGSPWVIHPWSFCPSLAFLLNLYLLSIYTTGLHQNHPQDTQDSHKDRAINSITSLSRNASVESSAQSTVTDGISGPHVRECRGSEGTLIHVSSSSYDTCILLLI